MTKSLFPTESTHKKLRRKTRRHYSIFNNKIHIFVWFSIPTDQLVLCSEGTHLSIRLAGIKHCSINMWHCCNENNTAGFIIINPLGDECCV